MSVLFYLFKFLNLPLLPITPTFWTTEGPWNYAEENGKVNEGCFSLAFSSSCFIVNEQRRH